MERFFDEEEKENENTFSATPLRRAAARSDHKVCFQLYYMRMETGCQDQICMKPQKTILYLKNITINLA